MYMAFLGFTGRSFTDDLEKRTDRFHVAVYDQIMQV